jgi:predicted metal-dependent phosphoesterase TrpH
MTERAFLLRCEFHCHTRYSKDSLTTPEALLAACRRKGLDRVVVTDHNTIAGALHAKKLDPGRVIVGEEIMTTQGELLAAYMQEEIPPGLTPAETIRRLRDQGAFISVSHPFDATRKGHWRLPDLLEIAPLVDAIEVFNARCILAEYNHQAAGFAREHAPGGTAGSDAHVTWELGRAAMLLPPFDDAASLRAALPTARMDVRLSPFWIHFTSRWAVWRKRGQSSSTKPQ